LTSPFDYAWAVLKQAGVDFNFDDARYTGETQPVSQRPSDFPNQGTLDAWGVPSTTMLGPQPNPNPPPPADPAIMQPWWARPYDSKKPDWRTAVGAAGLAAKKIGGAMGFQNPLRGFKISAGREAAGSNMLEPHYPGGE